MTKSKQDKATDRLIDQIYRDYCAGTPISVMRIPELFRLARGWIASGEPRERVGTLMLAFVEQEKL